MGRNVQRKAEKSDKETIRAMSVEERRMLAQKTKNVRKLHILSKYTDDVILCVYVASNSATVEKTLDDLSKHLSYFVQRKDGAHPNAGETTLLYLLKAPQCSVICAVARNENLPEEGFEILLNKRKTNVLCALMENPKITSEHLEKLSRKKNTMVKCCVARHPKTSKMVRDDLANDPDEMVRFEVKCYYQKHPEEQYRDARGKPP